MCVCVCVCVCDVIVMFITSTCDLHVIYSNPAEAKLRYTIVYNSSRALRFQQIYVGSLNKPDGRTGVCILAVSVLKDFTYLLHI